MRVDQRIPAIYVHHLIELTSRWGIEPGHLLGGITVDTDPLRWIPSRTLADVARRAMDLTGEPGLGVYFGMETRTTWHGFLGFAGLSSATVAEAIEFIVRFSATRTTSIGWYSGRDVDYAFLELVEYEPLGDMREFIVSWMLVGITFMVTDLVGLPLTGIADVTFAEQPHHARLLKYLPGPVRFGRPSNRLLFSPDYLALSIHGADSAALHHARLECERELDARGAEALVARVRAHLPRPGGGVRTLDEVAHELGASPRTIRRKLESQGTSFAVVLDDVRHHRALQLVADVTLPIERIARELGFSNSPNFYRAFRRWTGTSPSRFRRRE